MNPVNKYIRCCLNKAHNKSLQAKRDSSVPALPLRSVAVKFA